MTPLMQAVQKDIRIVRELRKDARFAPDYDTFAKLIARIRFCRDIAREELAEQAAVVEVDPYTTLATLEDIKATLGCASRTMQQYGATDAQVSYLAQLLVKSGATIFDIKGLTTLTKGEASIMIEDLKARLS